MVARKAVDVLPERLQIVLCGERRSGVVAGGSRLHHKILTIVLRCKVENVKSRLPEHPPEGSRAEIGAMLVVDIPESDIAEHTCSIGDLKKHGGVEPVSNGPPHHGDEFPCILDVLQGHLTADEIGLIMGILL